MAILAYTVYIDQVGGEEGMSDRALHYPHLILLYHVLYWEGKAGRGKEGGREGEGERENRKKVKVSE